MPSPPKSPPIGIRYVSDAVKSDHRLLERLSASLGAPSPTSSPDSPGSQRALCSRFAWELARHLVAMELFIFPGTAHRAKQGNQAAQDRQRDMAQLRDALRSFSEAAATSGPGREKLDKAFEELSGLLTQHIRDIERVELVNIEKVLSGQESEDLARDFERSVFFIPYGVRDEEEEDSSVKAPYKTVGGLLDAGAEELRAAMEKFPRE
ncbi:hypothetical protein N8I77_009746 [Diaporthe amygdali]|uniref:Hemerythrin-like domain-containing protein n=1 Tax=Phomopsis amygdali TaxID=1214568 RepID=A0AAD9SD94_PHOAM|nr:hypothetical protein N8I77_009746 [Diaporthe amygdali]